jgi:hypothetical protein
MDEVRALKLKIHEACKKYIMTHVGKNGIRHLNPSDVRLGTDYQHLWDSPHILQMVIEWVPGDTIEVYNKRFH